MTTKTAQQQKVELQNRYHMLTSERSRLKTRAAEIAGQIMGAANKLRMGIIKAELIAELKTEQTDIEARLIEIEAELPEISSELNLVMAEADRERRVLTHIRQKENETVYQFAIEGLSTLPESSQEVLKNLIYASVIKHGNRAIKREGQGAILENVGNEILNALFNGRLPTYSEAKEKLEPEKQKIAA